jgi:hypothetical protein
MLKVVMLSVVMLNVVMQSVVMLSVVAPWLRLAFHDFNLKIIVIFFWMSSLKLSKVRFVLKKSVFEGST